MKNNICIILLVSILFTSCQTLSPKEKNTKSRNIEYNKQQNNDEFTVPLPIVVALKNDEDKLLTIMDASQTINGFIVWDCKDYVTEEETLFQIGYFEIIGSESNKKETFGFIIFEEPFLKEIYWKAGTPMPGDIKSEADIPKGRVLSPSGIAPDAQVVVFNKEGLEYSWKWMNPKIENSSYEIVLQPDGTVLYYDFTNVPYGESVKAKDILKGSKHIVKGL